VWAEEEGVESGEAVLSGLPTQIRSARIRIDSDDWRPMIILEGRGARRSVSDVEVDG
jgi:hypothetical protein